MTCFMRAVTAVTFAALLFVVAAPASAVTPVAEHMTVYDSAEEIEPALISQARSGVDYVVTVYMKFNPNITTAHSTLQYAVYTSSGQSTFAGLPTSSALASYTTFADPVLAQQEGVTNPRIYLLAIGENDSFDSALIIWSSDNGGLSWTTPYVIESETTAGLYFDKDAITVGPDGSVHIAYLNHGASSAAIAYRSGTYNPFNDTWTWPLPTDVLGTSGNFIGPQVMVDTNSDVYILYVDGNRNSIRLVRKDAMGVSFAQVNDIPNTGQLYGSVVQRTEFIPLKTNVSIRAITVPVARLDRTNRRIAAAWHESDGAGHSQIRFASLETDGAPTWSNPLVIAAAGGHDINVGMAKDDLGKWLVTYYSFPGTGTDSYYSPVGTTVYFSGDTPMHDNGNNTIIGRLGDVADYGQSPAGSGQRYLGEYHDVSYSLGTFKSVHIIVAPIGNPWIFEVTH
jgi:hypothetical protein